METKSTQKIYDWIRDKGEDPELGKRARIAKSFPDGPHDESQELVDIVVVTPASTFRRASLSRSP